MQQGFGGIVVWGLTLALVLATLLPLTKLPFGAIRGLAFPRLQFACVTLVLGVGVLILSPRASTYLAGWILLICAVFQAAYIIKFTPIWPKQSLSVSVTQANPGTRISLLTANVKMSNRAYGRLLAQVDACDPDVLMAIEVDEPWVVALETALGDRYPHWIKVPKDNGYGLCLLSRLPLARSEIRTLVTRNVPSIRTEITLPSEDVIELNLLHPEPPVIGHDTKGRDSEIALIGLEVQNSDKPVIVAGDLNDVAWSTTTRRFQRLSGLLDPRVGRGLYNTFQADFAVFRWPLDHLFHDTRFRLISMKRLPNIGSDHFPIFHELALASTSAGREKLERATDQETTEVKEMIRSERDRERAAIGEDWEKDQ
ncbi:endonuclease/exonuclease/phosphatase family protein [uncultured Roseobacter sp.]|uniref:endonuclease/exonuclease/phosphatase family protein n=1 Tax=uncultured Roseobacter sp. TaxID=114847 RepID=UPI00262B5675|nr:endonuclease/exonuclease/phosphatase family protein [uncultured Roseobacter sp.]